MTYAPRFFLVTVGALALLFSVLGGCGRTTIEDLGVGGASGCGNGTCDPGETCSTCQADCGLCAGCGDGTCNNGENCTSCPEDCGVCSTCGNGTCDPGENCVNCAADCGKCSKCGDGTCDASHGETCGSCPVDCGLCSTCGDGTCQPNETCASCPQDCGVCSVCGNNKCEMPYETCINCPQDCGECTMPTSCLQTVTCILGCVGGGIMSPDLVQCIFDCGASGCANAQYLVSQVEQCAVNALLVTHQCGGMGGGGGIANCLMQACGPQIAACIATPCQ